MNSPKSLALSRVLLGATLLGGYWLRIYHIDLQAAMGDDAFTLVIGQQGLPSLLDLSKNEPHPPLFYLLLHFWQLTAGTSVFAGRYLGLWFGVAGLAALYRLGIALRSRWLGLLAAVLAAGNPFLIAFGQQVRMYTLAVMMATISWYLLLRMVRRPSGQTNDGRHARPVTRPAWLGRVLSNGWSAYFVASLLAVYSHFFAFFILLGQAVFVLLQSSRAGSSRLLRPWLGTQLAIVFCYLPWIAVAHQTLMTYTNGLVRRASLDEIVRSLVPTFLAGSPSAAVPPWVTGVAILLLVLGLFVPLLGLTNAPNVAGNKNARAPLRRRPFGSLRSAAPESMLEVRPESHRRPQSPDLVGPSVRRLACGSPAPAASAQFSAALLVIVCYLLVPVVSVYLVSLIRPMFFERYMVIMVPSFFLGIACGLELLARALIWPFALALTMVLLTPAAQILPGYYSTVLYASGADIQNLLAFVQHAARPGAAFVVNLAPSDPMYRYYRPAEDEYSVPNPGAGQQAATDDQLRRVLSGHSEIWLTPWDFDHSAYVERWLDEHAFRVDQHWFANAEVIRYESPLPPGPATASAATFLAPGTPIELRSVHVYSGTLRPGEPLLFTLLWQSARPVGERYKVFTHLLDAQNRVITQRDDEPVANQRPTTSWRPGEIITDNYALIVPPGTPPGTYRLEVGLYGLSDGVRLHLASGEDHLIGAKIEVRA